MTSPLEKLKAQLTDIMLHQPFSALINVTLTRLEKGYAQLEVPYSKELTQQHGFLHGGVVGFLADNVCAIAAATEVGEVVTQEYKINFLAPAIGKHFIGKGYVVRVGRRQVISRSDVYAITEDGTENHVATALATILPVSYDVKTSPNS
ncbi:MAG: PaaI family thioesterase [Emcibacter sp.]|nr:PaaI family thioesterase [Emcibacter sp.]